MRLQLQRVKPAGFYRGACHFVLLIFQSACYDTTKVCTLLYVLSEDRAMPEHMFLLMMTSATSLARAACRSAVTSRSRSAARP